VLVGVLVLGALFLAVLADGYLQSYRIGKKLEATYPKLQALRSALSAGRIPDHETFREAFTAVQDLRARMDGARFTFRLASDVPFLGRPVRAVRMGGLAVEQIGRMAVLADELVTKLFGPSGHTPLFHNGRIDLDQLNSILPIVEEMPSHVSAALADVQAMPHVPFVSRFDRLKARTLSELNAAQSFASRAASGFRFLPGFLGENGPRTYFLALQNNADQRGTGGAVLAFGILRVDHGRLRLARAGPIQELDQKVGYTHVYAIPPNVRFYLKQARHLPRINNGLNFTANFPAAARMWARQVGKAVGAPVDGAIALDPVAVAHALQGQGSFRAPAFPQPIDAHNVVHVTESGQYQLSKAGQAALPQQLVAGAFRLLLNPRDLATMARGVGAALAEKRIQLWFVHRKEELLVRSLGWSGALDPGKGDFLLVTQNKRIPNKVDLYTHQELRYSLRLAPSGDGQASAAIRLVNDTPPGKPVYVAGPWNPYALNLSMLDLYVPKRARDVVVTPSSPLRFSYLRGPHAIDVQPEGFVQHHDGQTRVYTKLVKAWPGHPGQLTYAYQIPRVATCLPDGSFSYGLRIGHQPVARPTVVSVRVQLPAGAELRSTDGDWTVSGGVAVLHAQLYRDLEASFVYTTDRPCR